jgi:hypothetical protein
VEHVEGTKLRNGNLWPYRIIPISWAVPISWADQTAVSPTLILGNWLVKSTNRYSLTNRYNAIQRKLCGGWERDPLSPPKHQTIFQCKRGGLWCSALVNAWRTMVYAAPLYICITRVTIAVRDRSSGHRDGGLSRNLRLVRTICGPASWREDSVLTSGRLPHVRDIASPMYRRKTDAEVSYRARFLNIKTILSYLFLNAISLLL